MDRFRWESLNGKKILHQDFSNLGKDDVITLLEQSNKEIQDKGSKDIYVITNLKSINFNRNTTKTFELISEKNKSYVKASAIFGVGTWQRVAIEAVGKLTGREFTIFKTEEEALKWLESLD